MTVNKEMFTEAMQDIKSCCETINGIISPQKKIQAHKGARLGAIRVTDSSCWRTISLPQWVVLQDTSFKHYRFNCTETGEFISWC